MQMFEPHPQRVKLSNVLRVELGHLQFREDPK